MLSISLVLVVALAYYAAGEEENPGILHSLINSFQLGVKNVVDQFASRISVPEILPPGVDLYLPSLRIPMPFAGGDAPVLPRGCPRCANLAAEDLVGTWHMVYANDNFLRQHLGVLAQLALLSQEASLDVVASINPSGLNKIDLTQPETLKLLVSPMRMPVCFRIQVGKSLSFGFITDFPVLISFKLGTPSSQRLQVLARLRQVSEGKYSLTFAGGKYVIRLCAIESNIPGAILEGERPPQTINQFVETIRHNQTGIGVGEIPPNIDRAKLEEILGKFLNQKPSTPAPDAEESGALIDVANQMNSSLTSSNHSTAVTESGIENSTSARGAAASLSDERNSTSISEIGSSDLPQNRFQRLHDESLGFQTSRPSSPATGQTNGERRTHERISVPSSKVQPGHETTGLPSIVEKDTPIAARQKRGAPNESHPANTTTTQSSGSRLLPSDFTFPKPAKFIVLGDTAGFPSCQNFVVWTSDQWEFFNLYDAQLIHMANKLGANSDVNPIHYVSCPCGHEEL